MSGNEVGGREIVRIAGEDENGMGVGTVGDGMETR